MADGCRLPTCGMAVVVYAVVYLQVGRASDEPGWFDRAVADVHDPVLVEPAGVAGTLGGPEAEVGTVASHLSGEERE
jgi:hypothetical protein